MAEQFLKINDENCINMGLYFEKKGEELQKYLDKYVEILKRIRESALEGGNVEDALDTYINFAGKFNGKIMEVGKIVNQDINKFIEEINVQDRYI